MPDTDELDVVEEIRKLTEPNIEPALRARWTPAHGDGRLSHSKDLVRPHQEPH
jgi:hypothetical protein